VKDDSALALLKTIGSLTSDGIAFYDIEENSVVYVNHSMVRIFDISQESFKHQPEFFLNFVIHEDVDHLLSEIEKLKYQSFVENVEFRVTAHDKTVKTINGCGYIVDDLVICFLRDITTQRENEEYMVNFGAKKDALLDMVSHNLSGPLNLTRNIITSMSNVVGKEDDTRLQKHLNLISESTNRCIEIVNDFLADEHLTSEFISVKRTRFDVLQISNSYIEGIRLSYPSKQLVVTTDATTLYANNDEVKFMQILQNLISNAMKFTPPDGRIEVIISQKAASFSLSVRDNGIGIPNNLQPVIFQKYTPAGREGLRGERSIGMGLYIVSKLVSILNGRLHFDSTEGEGSVFTVEFILD
jgi:two-component system, OmpR family, sensor histidine kinase VicK